jgi:hypothetical protein
VSRASTVRPTPRGRGRACRATSEAATASSRRAARAVVAIAIAAGAASSSFAADPLPRTLPVSGFVARRSEGDRLETPKDKAEQWRQSALRRAKVWIEPRVPVGVADLRNNPRGHGSFPTDAEVICKFSPGKRGGRTPKFECVFEGGEVLKVKYGRNQEVHTEVAASRLLTALGFGADTMYAVKRVRCFGCPDDPHAMLSCISSPVEEVRRDCEQLYGKRGPTGAYVVNVDTSKYVDFQRVAIERRKPGWTIEAKDGLGWGFDELEKAAAAGGAGATRAERDALRLIAVFLNNWDNQADNQRLICLPGGYTPQANDGCRAPFAYMHDVGGTFGRVGGEKEERKLDVEGWSSVPVWRARDACVVRIEAPRFHGATFGEATISEGGRALLARLLAALEEQQIRDLFEGAHFADYEGASEADRDVGNWVRAFQVKVRQITEGGPCPAA